jgi:G8 domain
MMKPSRALLLVVSILKIGCYVQALTNNDTVSIDPSDHAVRLLQATTDFVPLSCNANLASASCSTWTGRFGTGAIKTSRVIIPCGQCVTMNHPGPTLTFQDGIDIQGKLVFPNSNINLVVNTPLIVVQGVLDMQATKPVNGLPSIRFVLTGGNDQSFTPIGSNANACSGGKCPVGKKSFTVAGGRLNSKSADEPMCHEFSLIRDMLSRFSYRFDDAVRGLPANTPSWVYLRDISTDLRTIVVDATVQSKWAPGSEILITSHTTRWDGHQVRTIVQVAPYGSDGKYVSLTLSSAIDRPTTLIDSPDFAVEVALLSRNIVFQGGSDSITLHGGHFMVMQTPKVPQYIEGVDFQNFGQQGLLGRYPIHFHFCGDVTGSIVIKNTIRLSNQRCIVVHGTDNLRIESNVAYNTKGHCYIVEDGIETGNLFLRNLGAMTAIPQRLIPNMGFNGLETDKSPATFWMTNPTNPWIERNVDTISKQCRA